MNAITLIWQYPSASERDWVRFLLSDFTVTEIIDCQFETIVENAIVVMSSRRTAPRQYIERAAQTKRCILYQISDESFHGRYTDYSSFNFVFRNDWSSVFNVDGVRVLPIGYTTGSAACGPVPPATDRRYVWSFVGAPKASRQDALYALRDIRPRFVQLTGGPDAAPALDRASYMRVMRESAFCPCAMGNVHLETFRLYEALEAGCIPIVERRPTMNYYERLLPGFQPPVVRSWSEARTLIMRLVDDPHALNAKQQEIAEWWHSEKIACQAEVRQIIIDCFFDGRDSKKLDRGVKWIARLPGWRQLELLRHQSTNSALRRTKLELRRLFSPDH